MRRSFYQDRLGTSARRRGNVETKCVFLQGEEIEEQVRRRIYFAPFYTTDDHFTKTGSGQT
jgi:signal transduction histidine kinase